MTKRFFVMVFSLLALAACGNVQRSQQRLVVGPTQAEQAEAAKRCANVEWRGRNADGTGNWHCPGGNTGSATNKPAQATAEEIIEATRRCPGAEWQGRRADGQGQWHCPGNVAPGAQIAGLNGTEVRHHWLGFRKDAKRVNTAPAELAAAVRANGNLTMPAENYAKLVGQIIGRPFDGAAAFASWLESEEVQVVPCTTEIISQLDMARVDEKTQEVGFFHRACYPGENLMVWVKGDGTAVAFIAADCWNPVKAARRPKPSGS